MEWSVRNMTSGPLNIGEKIGCLCRQIWIGLCVGLYTLLYDYSFYRCDYRSKGMKLVCHLC